MEPQKKPKTHITSGNVNLADDKETVSAGNMGSQLKSIANNSKQLRVANPKDVKLLVDELGIDQIRATNILKKLDLQQAIKFLINQ